MSDSEIEDEGLRFYLIKHHPSASQAQIRCILDKDNNAKLLSVQLLSGKVISLKGVRDALKKIKKDYNTPHVPDETA
jgi:hypothetical protein